MNAPKFKEFLTRKVISTLLNTKVSNNDFKLYAQDTSFLPFEYGGMEQNIQFRKAFEKNIKEEDILNLDFGIEMKFDDALFNRGISFTQMKHLSEALNTDRIFIKGDGHDFSYSEYTSDHSSEIIITIYPEQKEKLLSEYKAWFSAWTLENQNKGKSVKPNIK